MYLNVATQRGSALVIAVFVIVVMLALTMSLSRLLISGSETVVYEVQGSRTLFAAQSGLELALIELFPLSAPTATCAAVSGTYSFSGPGLQGCTATVSCSSFTPAGAGSIYKLVSTADCSAAGFLTRRTLQIEVR